MKRISKPIASALNTFRRSIASTFSNNIILPSLVSTLMFATFAHAQTPAATPLPQPELVFQSGFEGTSKVVSYAKSATSLMTAGYEIETIIGKDTTLPTKSDWIEDIRNNPSAGQFYIEYTGGMPKQRFAKIIPEPGNPSNHVLQFWLGDSWLASEGQQKARIQTSLYGIRQGYKEFFHSQRVYLHPDFKALENYPEGIPWLTLGEYWNNEWWVKGETHGFRITLGLGKPNSDPSPLEFILNAENQGQKEVWRARTPEIKVPIGKWFTMETYFKEGDKDHGRFYVAIVPDGGTRQVVFDIHNFTHNTYDTTPDGITGFNPMKLYTSKNLVGFMKSKGKALQIYWDDFKLWKNKRPE